MVVTINALFTLLALFHLAYLGVMFGAQSENDKSLQAKVCLQHDITIDYIDYVNVYAVYMIYDI